MLTIPPVNHWSSSQYRSGDGEKYESFAQAPVDLVSCDLRMPVIVCVPAANSNADAGRPHDLHFLYS
jgi:hypothetical protein